jgi:hypothetical protein
MFALLCLDRLSESASWTEVQSSCRHSDHVRITPRWIEECAPRPKANMLGMVRPIQKGMWKEVVKSRSALFATNRPRRGLQRTNSCSVRRELRKASKSRTGYHILVETKGEIYRAGIRADDLSEELRRGERGEYFTQGGEGIRNGRDGQREDERPRNCSREDVVIILLR